MYSRCFITQLWTKTTASSETEYVTNVDQWKGAESLRIQTEYGLKYIYIYIKKPCYPQQAYLWHLICVYHWVCLYFHPHFQRLLYTYSGDGTGTTENYLYRPRYIIWEIIFGLENLQTWEPSDMETFGIKNLRTCTRCWQKRISCTAVKSACFNVRRVATITPKFPGLHIILLRYIFFRLLMVG